MDKVSTERFRQKNGLFLWGGNFGKIIFLLILLLLLLWANWICAQNSTDSLANLPQDPAEQLRISQEQEIESKQRASEQEAIRKRDEFAKKKQSREETARPAVGEPSFLVKKIIVHDVNLLKKNNLRRIIIPYENTRFNLPRINAVMDDLTQAYIDEGFITSRIYIKPQNIADGSLELVAVEGKIEKIVLGENKFGQRLKRFTAFPAKRNEILQLRTLEQGLDQINRVASLDAKLQMKPGTKEGYSIVQISGEPKDELRATLGVDNFGSQLTGEQRASLALEWDNLLNVNDAWFFQYLGSYDSNAFIGAFSFPFRWWTFSLLGSYSEYLADINTFTELLGQSYTSSFDIQRVIFRSAHHKSSLGLGLDYKRNERSINDSELEPQDFAYARLYFNHLWRKPNRVMTFGLEYSRGLPNFWGGDGVEGLEDEFNRIGTNIGFLQVVKPWLNLQSSLTAQYAFEPLLGNEQLFVGDYYGVRGYVDSGAAGDWGAYARNELTLDMMVLSSLQELTKAKTAKYFGLHWLKELKPYIFLDAAYAKSESTSEDFWLGGTGGGIRMKWGRFNTDLFFAIPAFHSGIVAPEDDIRFYFRVNLKAF